MSRARHAKRVDANQPGIVDDLRAMGCGVEVIDCGDGVPDLLVGYRGVNLVLEVKTVAGSLNADQVTWHREWPGQKAVVRDSQDAMAAVLGHFRVCRGLSAMLCTVQAYWDGSHELCKQCQNVYAEDRRYPSSTVCGVITGRYALASCPALKAEVGGGG